MAKILGENLVIRVPDDLAADLDNTCARTGANRSEVIRVLMRGFLDEVTEKDVVEEQARRKAPPGKQGRACKARQYLANFND